MSLSDLCQRCGLCCDGTLFSHVPLQPSEGASARQQGLDVVELVDGAPALRLCCTALKERQCTVYASRPGVCRRYGCRLFTVLAEENISLEEALSVVDQAHALLASLERGLPPDTDTPPSSVIQRARLGDLGEDGGLSPEVRALRERVEAFLDHHFHGGPRAFASALMADAPSPIR